MNTTNVYIDPSSYRYLNNVLFGEDTPCNRDNILLGWRVLRQECLAHGLHIETIDRWNSAHDHENDIYVSLDHKFLPRRLYWRLKHPKYPVALPAKFTKKILFQFEPPNVMPEIRYLESHVLGVYDTVFFAWKTAKPAIRHFLFPQVGSGVDETFWARRERKFLTLINSNRRVLFRHRELLTERIRAVLYFGKTNDIDLYGYGWEEHPLFPYWLRRNAIQRVYKGSIENKLKKLSEYNFALAFENCELPGYITEKMFDCLYVGTVPVYLGAPDVTAYIPKNCFIDMRDFQSYEELRNLLKSLSQERIAEYRENGRRFLESEQFKPFTKEHFAKLFVDACLH